MALAQAVKRAATTTRRLTAVPKVSVKPVSNAINMASKYIQPKITPAYNPAPTYTPAPAYNPPVQNLAQQYAKAVLPATINTPTSFEKVLPKSSIMNEDMVKNFAYSQVDPEIARLKTNAMDDLTTNLYTTGGQRFGQANVRRQNLVDQYSRMREEQALPFYQQGINKLSDYYNELSQSYYKDPNAFQYKPIDLNTILKK